MHSAAIEALIDRYCAAWSEPDAARRRDLLAPRWSPSATYTDPRVHVTSLRVLAPEEV